MGDQHTQKQHHENNYKERIENLSRKETQHGIEIHFSHTSFQKQVQALSEVSTASLCSFLLREYNDEEVGRSDDSEDVHNEPNNQQLAVDGQDLNKRPEYLGCFEVEEEAQPNQNQNKGVGFDDG